MMSGGPRHPGLGATCMGDSLRQLLSAKFKNCVNAATRRVLTVTVTRTESERLSSA